MPARPDDGIRRILEAISQLPELIRLEDKGRECRKYFSRRRAAGVTHSCVDQRSLTVQIRYRSIAGERMRLVPWHVRCTVGGATCPLQYPQLDVVSVAARLSPSESLTVSEQLVV